MATKMQQLWSLISQPSLDEIDAKLFEIDMALWDARCDLEDRLGSGYNSKTGEIEIEDCSEILARFPFTVTVAEIEAWRAAREAAELELIF